MFGFDVFYHKLNKEMTLDVTFKNDFESCNLIELIDSSVHNKDRALLLKALEEYCEVLRRDLEEEAYADCL